MAAETERVPDTLARMRLAVFSHKPCWQSALASSGFASDGGFPFQIQALSEIFTETRLLVPVSEHGPASGEIELSGHNLQVIPFTPLMGRGFWRKFAFPVWLLRNGLTILTEIVRADGVHAAIPGDVGTIGMMLALALRKPLFVRHCGNWFAPKTRAEHFWKWFMQCFAGGRNVMLATGGAPYPPSASNPNVRWIFSTSLTEHEMSTTAGGDRLSGGLRLIVICRQEWKKGTGVLIESLPEILRHFPEATLDVVGDGRNLADFKKLAVRLRVDEQVTFHGKVGHEEVLKLLRSATLFCYPTSASEGFPKVVLEALACRVPVLATRVSAIPHLLEGGGGVLLEEASPSALITAVKSSVADVYRYQEMCSRAAETARQYTLERWRDQISEILAAAWEPNSVRA